METDFDHHELTNVSTHHDVNEMGSSLNHWFDRTISASIFTLIVSSVLFNSKLICTIVALRGRKQNRANPTMMLILCLSISDVLYSTLPMLLSAASLANNRKWSDDFASHLLCNTAGIVFSVTVRVSILLILLISITRMIAILFPIKYRTITSPNRLYLILGFVWTLNLLVSLLPFVKLVYYKFIPHVALCNWSLHEVFKNETVMLVAHMLVMIVPFAVPGIMVLILYLLIISSIVRLKWMTRARKRGKSKVISLKSLKDGRSLVEVVIKSKLSTTRHYPWQELNRSVEKQLKNIRNHSMKVDDRLKQLIVSAFVTLTLVGIFCLCYMCWWALSIDFLIVYLRPVARRRFDNTTNTNSTQQAPSNFVTPIMTLLDLDDKGYLQFIVVSYVMILLSATTNPIIHLAAVKRLGLRTTPSHSRSESGFTIRTLVKVTINSIQSQLFVPRSNLLTNNPS